MDSKEFEKMVDSIMDKKTMDKNDLENILNNDTAKIEFTKKDGSKRIMLATKTLDLIPKDKHPKKENAGKKIKKPDYLLTVFDLEKKDWRSIRIFTISNVLFNQKMFKFNT